MEPTMRRPLVCAAVIFTSTASAFALDMPPRKAGLWELKMTIEGQAMPGQAMKQCTDAASDKVMNANFGGVAAGTCSKQDIVKTATGMTVDSVCTFGEATSTTHAVITGNFDSAYKVEVNSTRAGGPPMPGMPAGGSTRMTIEAKWIGPCASGQKPGDVVMPNGMTMNMLEMQKMMPPKRP
jgi:hypothetical protein